MRICLVHFCICPCHCALARFWIWLEALCQLICSAEMPFKFFPLLSFLGLSWVWSESRASSLDDGRRSLCRRSPPWGHYPLKKIMFEFYLVHIFSLRCKVIYKGYCQLVRCSLICGLRPKTVFTSNVGHIWFPFRK